MDEKFDQDKSFDCFNEWKRQFNRLFQKSVQSSNIYYKQQLKKVNLIMMNKVKQKKKNTVLNISQH